MTDPPNQRSLQKMRIAVAVVMALVLLVAYRLGVFQRFGAPEQLRETLIALGPWGYVAFIGAYALLQPFGVPGTVFIFAAPLIWPWPIAFSLSMVGTMAASVVGFSFARFIARDFVLKLIPQRFRKYDDALERRAFATVFLLRFIFWMPPLLHAFFGVSKVRFWTHFWGSLAAYVIPLLVVSLFGARLVEVLKHAPREVWVGLGVALVAAALIGLWLRRRRA